jgi:DNA polymerase-3 subunit beta
MNITLQGKTLLEALQLLARIPTRHPAQPVLAYTCITTRDDSTAEVYANGIGVMGRVIIPLETVALSGKVAVDQNTLITFLSSLKNMSKITLEVVEGVLRVISDDSTADVKTYPADSMPEFQDIEVEPWYSGSSTLFTDLVKRVSFACAVSDIRPELASVYIAIKQGFLVCAATDSFYLAEAKAPCESEEGVLLLPNKYVPHLLHTSSHSSKLSVKVLEGQCQFDSGNCSIIVRVVTGSYPQYEAIIPKEFQIQIETGKDEVVTALRIVKPFTDAQFPRVMLKPNSVEGFCVCETDYSDKGYGKSSFRALIQGDVGDDITIKINLDNIMKVLGVLSVDRLIFSCIDPMKPIMVTSPDDINFRALLMPVGR